MPVRKYRQAETNVDPLFINRWSPRAYTGEPIPDDVLSTSFEAARWAPSGSNSQPWRFLYAKRDSQHWDTYLNLLNERNRVWAANASALVVVVSAKTFELNGKVRDLSSRSFDAGAAWASFALQISLLGWGTRAIAGLDYDKAREVLQIPDDFDIEVAIAVGKPGDKSLLPEDLQAREIPNNRRPLSETVSEGLFGG